MESLVHYNNPCHALSALAALNDQRLRGQMCDVVLLVSEQRFQAHKSVLAASSEYFQTLFSRADAESLRSVTLDFCEPDAFEVVLNYIYTSALLVGRGSLAAIQELGYSLGIPFLTNIATASPHASYSVSRKRLSSDGEESDPQARSVIVCHVQDAAPSPTNHLSDSSAQTDRGARGARKASEESERRVGKGSGSLGAAGRPQLTSSVSFGGAEVPHIRMGSGMKQEAKEEDVRESERSGRSESPSPQSHAIDRSGPLIKSLLRRSLSMDSPVPVFSPKLELKEVPTREHSVVKLADSPPHNGSDEITAPRPKYAGTYIREAPAEPLCVKDEPSSPLGDPMDIVRITVGETLPACFRELEPDSNEDLDSPPKRRNRPDNRRYPFKKARLYKGYSLPGDTQTLESLEADPVDEVINDDDLYKCWNCAKVFRSNTGLHRHVNMYHNPEKPYACDICHKRFHTNFKVWTHYQTQHGVVQNPASSGADAGGDDDVPLLDEKFQRKLIDMVREREIKKTLLRKLKRNRPSLQPPLMLGKPRPRARFACQQCGKTFTFHSKYKQHIRTHLPRDVGPEDDAVSSRTRSHEHTGSVQRKRLPGNVYPCRLCNLKLLSLAEQGEHERGCRHATVCPYCGLRFSSPAVKWDHEPHCKYKKLTCLECMRTFKSSFSIWRHQVEVHNHNMMTVRDHLRQDDDEEEAAAPPAMGEQSYIAANFTENARHSDSPGGPMFDSEDSSSYAAEDLSAGSQLVVKEEPMEELVSAGNSSGAAEDGGVWPCEKCGTLFGSSKDLERHQELLCLIKPFICHVCGKAFRTNFRLWSHFQSHMSGGDSAAAREASLPPPQPALSPSPPLTPQTSERPSPQPMAVKFVAEPSSPEPQEPDRGGAGSPASRSGSREGSQDPDTLFYHAPSLAALTFKRQYMCKLCHRTFKTAFSLWSHEQTHM